MIHRQAGLVWFYGNTDARGTFDHLTATHEPPKKSADLSTVCSAKQMRHTLHSNRVAFTHALKAAIPEMEVFGQGVREIPDKADALDPFRYHLAIENHVAPHHWTEKLSDPFLGWCLPIYHGCPNAAGYFPEDSFIPIDILNYGAAKDRVLKAIRDDEYTRRLPAIREARRLALYEYATFPQIARLITERHHPQGQHASCAPPGASCSGIYEADAAHATSHGHISSRRLWRKRHPVEAACQLVQKTTLQLHHRLTQPTLPCPPPCP